jgi:ParB family chromosome partitioning protein
LSLPVSTNAPVVNIAVDLVDVVGKRRKLDPAWVVTLADLFSSQGQKTAIEVIATDERFRLVFGHHRLAAAQSIGWREIRATVKSPEDFASEAEITLAEITENLARRELSVLDRAVDIVRWREVYEATHLLNKGGRKRKDVDPEELSTKFGLSFSEAAQKAFGLSRASIFNAVKIASIAADVRDRIALHDIANNQSELLQLAAEPAERQASIAALLTAEPPQAGSVAEAIAILDRLPKPAKVAGWQKLSETFSRMKPADQRRFFELHEAAIAAWLKERAS